MISFISSPGPRERHLQRKFNNPLFCTGKGLTQQDVELARHDDGVAMQRFMEQFRELVQQAVKLDKSVDSEVILLMKMQLEQLYAVGTGLQGKPQQIPDAIRKLITAISSTMRSASEQDAHAQEKLERDEAQTNLHYYLSGFSIVSDLLNPDGIIEEDEFLPALLNEEEESLNAALALFPPEQVESMLAEGRALLQKIEGDGHSLPEAWQRLAQMESWMKEAQSD